MEQEVKRDKLSYLIYCIITIMILSVSYIGYIFIMNDISGINDLYIDNPGKMISLFGLLLTLISYIIIKKKNSLSLWHRSLFSFRWIIKYDNSIYYINK